jgi:hypothetical protein
MRLPFFITLVGGCTPGVVMTPTQDCDECEAGETDTDTHVPEADAPEADTDTDTYVPEADTDTDTDTDTEADTDTDTDTDADPVDEDGDGYVDVDPDCDDNDPDIHPGATEVCNGVDDDCDGNVDEGCDSSDEDQVLSLTVDHAGEYDLLTLNYQPIWDVSEIGDWWWDSETVTSDDLVSASAIDDFAEILGIRLNVTRSTDIDNDGDYDSSSWLCEGHYATAAIDGSVKIDIVLDGVDYDEDDLLTWSPGSESDVSLGCSALLWFGDPDEITDGAVY